MLRDKSGQMIMINLLIFVMVIFIAVAMVPVLRTVLDTAQENDALNCKGYIDRDATATANGSYNSSLNSEELACIAIDLYIPYILLVVLVGGVTNVLLRRGGGQMDQF